MSTRARTGLWLVTPAWQRFELSALCFDQHALAMRTLEQAGVETHHVVVADDRNLELAERHGWDTVERDNDWLGRRFNDGIEYALNHGAEWVVPIGSDSWIDPAYFLPLPARDVVRTSRTYSVLTHRKLGELVVGLHSPAGPHMLTRELLELVDGRPVAEKIRRGCDASTVWNIERASGAPMPWEFRDVHPHQYVGLRGIPAITQYHRIVARWGVAEHEDPWPLLTRYFPVELVDRARDVLERQHRAPRYRASDRRIGVKA